MSFDIKVGSRNYNFFTRVVVDLKFGHAASAFSLAALYESENPDHVEIFRPLTFQDVQINSSRGERLITGTGLNNSFETEARQKEAVLSGYSKTGVLQECQIPLEAYPLQYNGLSLLEIAQKIVSPFGITVAAVNDGGAASEPIDEVTSNNSETVIAFLRTIAAQRNLFISNTPDGRLIFTRPNLNERPIATYREETPSTKISLKVRGQNMHSSLTAVRQADIERDNAAESTVNNSLIPAFRPSIQVQNVGTESNTEEVAKNLRAAELRNIRLMITSDRWTWLNGNSGNAVETITPNHVISVISPENYIYRPTKFFVEQVRLIRNDKKESSVLTCVLPEVYSNEEPTFNFR